MNTWRRANNNGGNKSYWYLSYYRVPHNYLQGAAELGKLKVWILAGKSSQKVYLRMKNMRETSGSSEAHRGVEHRSFLPRREFLPLEHLLLTPLVETPRVFFEGRTETTRFQKILHLQVTCSDLKTGVRTFTIFATDCTDGHGFSLLFFRENLWNTCTAPHLPDLLWIA